MTLRPAQVPGSGRPATAAASGGTSLPASNPSGTPRSRGRSRKATTRWHFVVLAEIGNFAILRRLLGRARAEILIVDVALRIADSVPHARMRSTGRALIELEFEGGDRGDLDTALDCLVAAFDLPFEVDGEELKFEMLFGAAAVTARHFDEVRLDEEAEEALAEARLGRRSVSRELRALPKDFDLRSLSRDLSRAVARGEMFLQYQPKVHLRRQEVTGAEALIRWNHPKRGLIQPNDFIALAEEAREIAGLTLWALRQVIEDYHTLTAQSFDLRLYINISGQLLGDDAFVARVCNIVEKGKAKLGFEITETSVIRDPKAAIANLQRFADIGVSIAIDDYGSGLSSLAYLKQLPASELKIDKLFVTQLTSSNRDPLIVRSTIDLAHAMEMEVVAEGVETQAALALLSVMGCDLVQGFLISRPIGLAALADFLTAQSYLDSTADPRASFANLAAVWKRG